MKRFLQSVVVVFFMASSAWANMAGVPEWCGVYFRMDHSNLTRVEFTPQKLILSEHYVLEVLHLDSDRMVTVQEDGFMVWFFRPIDECRMGVNIRSGLPDLEAARTAQPEDGTRWNYYLTEKYTAEIEKLPILENPKREHVIAYLTSLLEARVRSDFSEDMWQALRAMHAMGYHPYKKTEAFAQLMEELIESDSEVRELTQRLKERFPSKSK